MSSSGEWPSPELLERTILGQHLRRRKEARDIQCAAHIIELRVLEEIAARLEKCRKEGVALFLTGVITGKYNELASGAGWSMQEQPEPTELPPNYYKVCGILDESMSVLLRVPGEIGPLYMVPLQTVELADE